MFLVDGEWSRPKVYLLRLPFISVFVVGVWQGTR